MPASMVFPKPDLVTDEVSLIVGIQILVSCLNLMGSDIDSIFYERNRSNR